MAKVDYHNLYAQRHMRTKIFSIDELNMTLYTDSYTHDDDLIWQNALAWFAAGYEDALAVYLNEGGYEGGAQVIAEKLGMNVNYASIANLYLNTMKIANPDPIKNKDAYDSYCQTIKFYVDKAREHNQVEYEYFEAEYLALCGKREEAKAAFLKIYKAEKPFGYYALKRANEMYFEEHPEEKYIREKNKLEIWGSSTLFTIGIWALVIVCLTFSFTIALIPAMLFFIARFAKNRYDDNAQKITNKFHYPYENLSADMGTFTKVITPYANASFKKNIFEKRPNEDNYRTYTETVRHENAYQEQDGSWSTFRYTTEEVNPAHAQSAQDKKFIDCLKWHDGVRESVRLHRIENWKRLKARVDQGDKIAEMLMDAMGFNQEHHNNGVAQIHRSNAKMHEFFSLNAVACWAPFELID